MSFIEMLIISLIVAMLALLPFAIRNDVRSRGEFYRQCEKDRKKYECDVLWRQAKGQVVPMFIPVGR